MEDVIAELIRKHKRTSWLALENAIGAANEFRKKQVPKSRKKVKITIDRRKLQHLAEERPNVPMTRYEYELLDSYLLRRDGSGLAEIPIFRRQENLFTTLSGTSKVSFFVGVRSVEALNTDVIARWDVSALNAMKDRISTNVETESFEVITRDTVRSMKSREWQNLRKQATGTVVVSIGSPIASASSEYLLADMFGFVPYREPQSPSPIRFIHSGNETSSAFTQHPRDVDGLQEVEAALLINGEPYVSSNSGAEFGIIAGRRTGTDQAAFVVAGNSGPGTYAAAEFFASGQVSAPLPDYESEGPQPVVLAVVSTRIHTAATNRRIDNRTTENTRLAAAPLVFRYKGSQGWDLHAEQQP